MFVHWRFTSKMILRQHRPSQHLSTLWELLAPRRPCTRRLHGGVTAAPVPAPIPFVPDVQTFLKLIGRDSVQHAAKFPSWEALFSLSSAQMRDAGLEPPRARRYILRWRDKFRKGEFGVGGDLTEVVNGAAEVRIIEVPAPNRLGPDGKPSRAATGTINLTPGMKKIIVNVKPGAKRPAGPLEQAKPVNQLKIRAGHLIVGPYVRPKKGSHGGVARIAVEDGMWEHKRGRKIDGGERRRAEVRAKRRSKEKE